MSGKGSKGKTIKLGGDKHGKHVRNGEIRGMILCWNITNLISFVALNGRRYILVKSLSSKPDAKSFFSEVGGGRSSRLNRILYIALHDSEHIKEGGVAETLEHSCNSFFHFWGIEEGML